ncbi:MAG: DUF2953 domain-containing protein [Bacillota bacterium]
MLWLFFKIIMYVVGLTYLTVCFIPFEYAFYGHKYENHKLQGRISWLLSSIGISFKISDGFKPDFSLHVFKYQISVFKDEKANNKVKQEEDNQHKKKTAMTQGLEWLSKDLLEAGLRFVRDIVKHMKPKHIHIKGRIGFENPYYTGILSGLIYSITPFLHRQQFDVMTVFEDEVVEGEFAIQGRVIIGVLCIIVLRLLVTKPVRNIIKKMIRIKKEEKSYVI